MFNKRYKTRNLINKIFKLEDKNNEIKGTINDGKKSYFTMKIV